MKELGVCFLCEHFTDYPRGSQDMFFTSFSNIRKWEIKPASSVAAGP